MFEYSKGYEIDGSDTSYTIVTSERHKCLEILEYYLRQKVVHKGMPIEVTNAGGPGKKLVVGNKYTREELHHLWEDLRVADITFAELKYQLVAPNCLYPEVKRDLLDELIRLAGKKPKLVAPEFCSSYDIYESIIISLTPKAAKNAYQYSCCACGENYVKDVLETPYFTLEVLVSRNSPHQLHYYVLKKLGKAFPEMQIDSEKLFHDIMYYRVSGSVWLNHSVFERIEVPSADHSQVLNQLATREGFEFDRPNRHYDGKLDLANLYYLSVSKFDYEYVDVVDDSRSHRSDPEVKMLLGMFRKTQGLTIREYMDGVNLLSDAEYFSDEIFTYYTTVCCKLLIDDCPQYSYIKFERRNGGLVMILSVPWRVRGQVLRMLGL